MTDCELIRLIFDRINETPLAEQAAFRARIVRALRGELPCRPEQCEEVWGDDYLGDAGGNPAAD